MTIRSREEKRELFGWVKGYMVRLEQVETAPKFDVGHLVVIYMLGFVLGAFLMYSL